MGAGGGHSPLLLSIFILFLLSLQQGAAVGPTFDVPIVNVTVVAGQTAVLPCSINRIGDYKVAWTNQEGMTFTYHNERVIDDPRVSVLRPFIKEWNLQIWNVKYSDQGQYRCTLNTEPVKSKIVMLYVKVPSKIIDELSSDDITVQEGETVVLVCNATGVPRPEVTWYRRKISSRNLAKESTCGNLNEIGHIGEMIIIQNVSRYCDDVYECVAFNGVKPAVSRTIRVTVEFKPEINLRSSRIIQRRGKDTILDCVITAYPQASIYWEKEGKRISSSLKHRIENYDEGDHTITLSLQINDLDANDFGAYKCVAENKIGRDEEVMYLDEPADGYKEESQVTEKVNILKLTTQKPPKKPNKYPNKKPAKSTNQVNNMNKEKNHDGQVGEIGKVTGSSDGCRAQLVYVWITLTCAVTVMCLSV